MGRNATHDARMARHDAALPDEVGSRVSWLLRVSRAVSPGSTVDDFAGRLAGCGIQVNALELADLEDNQAPIGADLISAYETLLDLPAGQLLGPCEAMSRTLAGRALQPPRVLPAPEVRRELDRLAEVVRHGRPTGSDWLSLAQLLTQPDGIVLPGFLEDDWLYQLVDELSRSVGVSYLSRAEALARIMGDELHAQRLVAIIRDRVHEAGAQASVDALAIWGTGRDAASVDAAIVLLSDDDTAIRRGASIALLRRLARSRLTESHVSRIAETLRLLVQDRPSALGDDAIALGHRISPDLGADLEAVGGPTAPAPEDEPAIEEFRTTIAAAIDLDQDPVLGALLREAFTSQHPERRSRAALMIAASPYAPAVARTAVALQQHDPPVAHRAGRLLVNLARHVGERDLVPLLASGDPVVRRYALTALAHGPGLPFDLDLGSHLIDPDTARAAVYAAGMCEHPALQVACRHRLVTADVRRAAQWWQEHGGRVNDTQQGQP